MIPSENSKKFGWKIFLSVIFLFLLGFQAASQYVAYTWHYHPMLGAQAFNLYPFWSVLVWYAKWGGSLREIFFQAFNVGLLTTGVGFLVLLFAFQKKGRALETLHGSARWASKKDLQKAGLLKQRDGVYIGAFEDRWGNVHYLRHHGPEHVLTFAPTRSGKGVSLVIPTLLSWSHSAVITDLKGELWKRTSGWRHAGAKNRTLRFEPATMEGSACWNPLSEVRIETPHEVADAQNLATLLVDPDGRGLENHWQKTAQALLTGLILHMGYKAAREKKEASLADIDACLSSPDQKISRLWTEMSQYPHILGKAHPVVAASARDMLDRPPEEAGSVLSTAKSYLSLYRDPVIANNTSRCDFRIKDLVYGEQPVSLYLITKPVDLVRLRPLLRTFLAMMVRMLADDVDLAPSRHPLLVMLDEFPSLGKIEIIQESLAFIGGYGIRFYFICQDLTQLKSRETGYGENEKITSNCHIQNAFAPNRVETAEYLSRLIGKTTIIKEHISSSASPFSFFRGQRSASLQEVGRLLLMPDEILRLPGLQKNAKGDIQKPGDMLIFVAGHPPIYGKQILYFKDPIFKARAALSPLEREKI